MQLWNANMNLREVKSRSITPERYRNSMCKSRWATIKDFYVETGYEALADEVKVKLISAFYDNQEEAYLEIKYTEEELNE